MKGRKIILVILIITMVASMFSGCGGGGNPLTPPIEDEEQEYVVEEKSFNVDADQGGTFSLSDGTELKIDPGDLSDDAYVVLKRVRYDDLDFSKTWWADENPYVWLVDIIDCDDLLGNIELYMVPSQLEYIGGEISGGIVRLKDGAFELVNEFTASVGEKVLVSIEEIGKTAYLFVTNPINDVMIMNDLVEDISLAVQYYYDENCTSLFSLYQQAQQEEGIAGDDLENYPGVTREDAEEIFAKVDSWETIIDFGADLITTLAPNPVTATYSIYSAVVGIGEICKYTNAYMIAKNKADIYSSKIFKRRVIEYLYKQGCIGNENEANGTYALRDIGPAGGYIFYDKGSYSDGWRYLETAPASTEWPYKEWGSYGTLIGGTGTGIGTGQNNTTKIVTWLNSHSETGKAAKLCSDLNEGGYSDWFLPSKDELNEMYKNLKIFGVGGFESGDYWSSSEYLAYFSLCQRFSLSDFDDGMQLAAKKVDTNRVRAVRAF